MSAEQEGYPMRATVQLEKRDPYAPENPPVQPITDEDRRRNSSTSDPRELAEINNTPRR